MSYFNQNHFYDHLCVVLTNYEGNGSEGMADDPEPLYELLVEIQGLLDDGTLVYVED